MALSGLTGATGLVARGICGIGLPRSHFELAHTLQEAYVPKTSRVLWQQRRGAVIVVPIEAASLIACAYRPAKHFHLQVFSCCPARRPSVVRGNTIAARQESGFKSGRVAVCAGRNSRLSSSPEELGNQTENRSRCSNPGLYRGYRREIRGGTMPKIIRGGTMPKIIRGGTMPKIIRGVAVQ